MPNVLIRDLPPDVHATLVRRAGAAGQSLQQYLKAELTRMAGQPTMAEWLASFEGLEGGNLGGFAEVVKELEAVREERDAELEERYRRWQT